MRRRADAVPHKARLLTWKGTDSDSPHSPAPGALTQWRSGGYFLDRLWVFLLFLLLLLLLLLPLLLPLLPLPPHLLPHLVPHLPPAQCGCDGGCDGDGDGDVDGDDDDDAGGGDDETVSHPWHATVLMSLQAAGEAPLSGICLSAFDRPRARPGSLG